MIEALKLSRLGQGILIGIGLLTGLAVWVLVPRGAGPVGGSSDGGLITVAIVLYLVLSKWREKLSPAALRALAVGTLVLTVAGGLVYLLMR